MSRDECVLCSLDIAPAKPNAAKLGQRPSQFAAQVRTKFLAREQRLLLCFRAGSAQSENFSAVHATASMEASDRPAVVPLLHRLRPLLGKVVLPECL
jgi:hypothetical protein